MMIAGLLLAVLTIATVKSVNPCHSECEPYMCHGPLATQCEACPGNRRLLLGNCICKAGWLDKPGAPCSVFNFDCIEGPMDAAFNVYCTKCEHASNGPFSGVCLSRNWTYYNSNEPRLYTGQQEVVNRDTYLLGKCATMIQLAEINCASCKKNFYKTLPNDMSC